MNIKSDNRRKFHRINSDGRVNLDFINESYDQCQLKNLSLSGMFVMGNFQQQQTEDCLIDLFHKSKSKEINLRASTKVVWKNDEGIAFKFISMKFDSYMALVTTLIHEAEEPSAILQELPNKCPFVITSL
jgi:hypothetical protein